MLYDIINIIDFDTDAYTYKNNGGLTDFGYDIVQAIEIKESAADRKQGMKE